MTKIVAIKGFTLLELLITVAIVAVLAGISYPPYQVYIAKARRVDAITALLDLQLKQERYRAKCDKYAQNISPPPPPTPEDFDCNDKTLTAKTSSKNKYYTLSFLRAIKDKYKAVAALKRKYRSADPKCRRLTINQDGKRGSGSLTKKNGPDANAKCWGVR